MNNNNNNKDLIITIGIHILMPIVYFFVFISSLFVLFYSLAWSIDYDFDNPKINIKIIVFIIICLLYFLVFILRILILPFWYSIIEKKSCCLILKKFINNLKYSLLYRLIILLIVELPFLLLTLGITYNTIPQYKDFIPILLTIPFVFDLLGCYIILFLWWDIQKFIKRIKSK